MDLALTRDLLQEHGLGVGCSRGLTFEADVSSEDPPWSRVAWRCCKGVDITARLGGRYFGGILYGAMAKYGHPCTPRGRRNAIEAVRRIADFAGERGVTLGLEVVNRYESNLLNTAAQALEFIDEVGQPHVCVHLDTYHMNIEEADLAAPVLACGQRLGYVHIGENHRGYLGAGHIDFAQFFGALAQIGYQGTVTFELLVGHRQRAAVERAGHLAPDVGRRHGPGPARTRLHGRRAGQRAAGTRMTAILPPEALARAFALARSGPAACWAWRARPAQARARPAPPCCRRWARWRRPYPWTASTWRSPRCSAWAARSARAHPTPSTRPDTWPCCAACTRP